MELTIRKVETFEVHILWHGVKTRIIILQMLFWAKLFETEEAHNNSKVRIDQNAWQFLAKMFIIYEPGPKFFITLIIWISYYWLQCLPSDDDVITSSNINSFKAILFLLNAFSGKIQLFCRFCSFLSVLCFSVYYASAWCFSYPVYCFYCWVVCL